MFNRKTSNEKLSVRYTLKEKEIRSQMTNFYISLATHANAEVFLKNNPALIDKKIARGNDFTKDKTVDFSYWLKILQVLAMSDEKFEKQILGPVRDVANYVLNIKGRTTKIAGWVFAKSKPFEDTFSGGTRISVSLLVPELRTVMSLRCDAKTGAKIDYGFYDFEQVKPIPMTNRLHQFHPDIKKIEVGLNIAECNFLKTSMGDLKPFSCSLEMEHYCEVSSNQSKKRHLLGAVLIIGGKVVSVEWPYLRIASVVDPDQEYEFHMSEDLEKISHANRPENK